MSGEAATHIATIRKLQTAYGSTLIDLDEARHERDEARAEADRLRATLGKVAEVLDRKEGALRAILVDPEQTAAMVTTVEIRAILAADPVSLADVREVVDTLTLSKESFEAVGTSIQNAAGGVDYNLPEYVVHAITENLIASTWLRDRLTKAHDAEVAAAARAALLSEAIQYSNKRATPAGPFVWSVTLGELEQIVNRANGANR